jgi:hypothetical protein
VIDEPERGQRDFQHYETRGFEPSEAERSGSLFVGFFRFMRHVQSFAPIEDADAKTPHPAACPARLRPGGQYYAHPQNLFWRIMGEPLGTDPASPYEQRTQTLKSAVIALWDVFGHAAAA